MGLFNQDDPEFTVVEDLTDADILNVLADYTGAPGVLTATAGDKHTGAMVALVPSEVDIARLALDDGEDPEELHLTLLFLGDAADISENTRASIIETVTKYAQGNLSANAFSVNVFNPTGDNPCLVMGVGNDDGSLSAFHSNISSAVGGLAGLNMPQQHTPWTPHITLAYTDDFSQVADLAERTGAVTFDRIRVAFAGEVTDIPLEVPMTAATEEFAERNVKAPGPTGHGLRNYWTKGEGAAKIRWGTDGSFNRCVSQLGEHVRDPQGLCAEYHKAATGEWPAEKGVESAVEMMEYSTEGVILTASQKVQGAEDEPWEGVLTVEGEESGDGRLFGLGALDWAELPMPLMYQPASVGGHDASVLAGAITFAARKGSQIYGRGHVFGNMLAGEHGPGIRNMMSTGGVSVDVDKVKDADVEMVYADSVEAGFMAKPELTVFHRGRIRGATLVAFPAFVEAKLSFVGDVTTASAEDCGCTDEDVSYVLTAASHTITIPDLPPAEWFSEPTDVKMAGALTITDEGRVYGYLAPSGVTHRSVNQQVPMGARVDYSRFMKSETIVAGGGRVVTGVITGNCGHAATEHYGTLQNRKDHYDNSCSIFANIVIGQRPGKGVWVAGALRHGVSAEQVAAAMGCTLSGDWQPHPDRPGVQEFIAALLVPVPGFAMARTQASVSYQDGAITTASVPVRFGPAEPVDELDIARSLVADFKELLVASLDGSFDEQRAALMQELELE